MSTLALSVPNLLLCPFFEFGFEIPNGSAERSSKMIEQTLNDVLFTDLAERNGAVNRLHSTRNSVRTERDPAPHQAVFAGTEKASAPTRPRGGRVLVLRS